MSHVNIIRQEAISETIYRMTLESGSIARACEPGQFVHLLINESLHPLLRRPFSIHRIDASLGYIDLIYRIVGEGTCLMSLLKPGDTLDLMGPLGHGFTYQGPFDRAIVVAGGMGSAPVFFLIDRLLSVGKSVTFFWGVKTAAEIYDLDWLGKNEVTVHIATEDGSRGFHGLLTEKLSTALEPISNDHTQGFICGPEPLLKAVQAQSRLHPFRWQVSIEEIMACGEGVCMGCAQPMTGGGYSLVCKDGPVFDLQEIVFND